MASKTGFWAAILIFLSVLIAGPLLAGGHGLKGEDVAVWMAIPFAGILLSIAIFPLVAPHFWHHHFGKIAAFWAVVGGGLLFLVFPGKEGSVTGTAYHAQDVIYDLAHIILLDYVPFIVLLFGLFTIAGGIRIKGTLRGSPKLNTLLLLIGTILASWMGTTGAAMVMIRPLIKANAWRKRKVHLIVFFIFLVCNIGGALTPLGDPPLFLGFLRGVSFTWTFSLLPWMGLLTAALLILFFFFDSWMLGKEEHKTPPAEKGESDQQEKLGLEGIINIPLLACLIGAILLGSSLINPKNGKLYDHELHASYEPIITAADKRNDALKSALKNVSQEGKRKEVVQAYQNALMITNHLASTPLPEPGHGEEEHSHEHEEVKHEHADAHVSMASKLETYDLKAEKLKEEQKNFAGGLEARLQAVQSGASAETIQSLILRDYQHSVSETNGLRAKRSHDAVASLHLPGSLPHVPWANIIRDGLIILFALLSLKLTKWESRKKNGFSWFPIVEVAKLFAAIFICIVPALKILQAGIDGQLASVVDAVTTEQGDAINQAYFWFTGILSSFLDNAPTYLVFFNTAGGDPSFLMDPDGGFYTLLAISMGAVFMGANTYIGNAPNFMIKSIAEESDIKMPSFFGYMIWSFIILVPFFILISFLAL